MNPRTLSLAIVFLLSGQWHPVAARMDGAEEIVLQAQQNSSRFHTYVADMRMTVKAANGDTNVFDLKTAVRNRQGDVDKVYVVLEPSHLNRTALLISKVDGGEKEHWFYLSARKRARRIYPIMQTGRFLNTAWTYEDMQGPAFRKFSYRVVKSAILDDRPCVMIEAVLRENEHSGYSRQIQWIDMATYDMLKTEFYDNREALLKTLEYEGYEVHPGDYRHPRRLYMIDHQSGRTLQVDFANLRFDAGTEGFSFDRAQFNRVEADQPFDEMWVLE